MKRLTRSLLCALIWLSPALALANWTATGRFTYTDRMYDVNGFTGEQPQRSIRWADIEILDTKNKVLALGRTDDLGNFSILVPDTSTRNVYARVITRTTRTPGLFVSVQSNDTGKVTYYAVKSPTVTGHGPNTNLNFGIISAPMGQGGEAFNILDQLVRGADYIALLRGSRPGSADEMGVIWGINRGETDSNYSPSSRRIRLRDTGGYDDTVVLHEMGHYFTREFSATSSPNGSHTFSNCNIDIRLAWEEGFATYWGNSALRAINQMGCNIYMRSNGGPGPGNLVRYADLETDAQYLCDGSASEVNVFTALWDLNDTSTTNDGVPGDDPQDLLALPDTETWQVMRDFIPTAANISLEDFWDGWFLPPASNGFLPAMTAIFSEVGVDFVEDAAEENGTPGTATVLTVGAAATSATLFLDTNGDGAGEADDDWYLFTASEGTAYQIETSNLVSDGNTRLDLYDSDGSTLLAFNDDRTTGDPTSLIVWTAPRSDMFYVRVTHAPDQGIYGSYQVGVAVQ